MVKSGEQCVKGGDDLLARIEKQATNALDFVLYGAKQRPGYDPIRWLDAHSLGNAIITPQLTERGRSKVEYAVREALRREVACLDCTRDDGDRKKILAEIAQGIEKIAAAVRTAILAVHQVNLLSAAVLENKTSPDVAALLTAARSNADQIVAAERERIVNVVHSLLLNVRNAARGCEVGHRLRISTQESRINPLTRLPNLSALKEYYDRLQQVLSGRPRDGEDSLHRDGCAVLFVDVDRLKDLNENFGHDGADNVLKAVAQRLDQGCREQDMVSHIHGDEFVIVLRGVTLEAARERAEFLRGRIAEYGDTSGTNVTISIGVAHLDPATARKSTLMEAKKFADDLMYVAKGDKTDGKGRNRVAGGSYRLDNVFMLRKGT